MKVMRFTLADEDDTDVPGPAVVLPGLDRPLDRPLDVGERREPPRSRQEVLPAHRAGVVLRVDVMAGTRRSMRGGVPAGSRALCPPLRKASVVPIDTGMEGEFSPIEGYPGYRVSSTGEVQSCWSRHARPSRMTGTWLPLRPARRRWGHLTVNLSRDGRRPAGPSTDSSWRRGSGLTRRG